MDDHEYMVLELYALKLIVTEVILACAAAEGYVNGGEHNPWPLIPWTLDKQNLIERVWTQLDRDPYYRKLRSEHGRRLRDSVTLRLLDDA